MIYLISDWEKETVLDEEHLYTLSKFFLKEGRDFQLILTNYVPFLLHKLNEKGYNSDDLTRVYDLLQGINVLRGHPLTIDEVEIPPHFDRLYMPDCVLLLENGKQVGKVFFNEYGFVSQVRYFDEVRNIVDFIYDGRGFLSSKRFANAENEDYRQEFFNEKGELKMLKTPEGIELIDNVLLSQKYFSSIEEVVKSLLSQFIRKEKEQVTVITVTEKSILEKTNNIVPVTHGKILRILTNESTIDKITGSNEHIIIDTKTKINVPTVKEKYYIPIFYPRLNLGVSSTSTYTKIYTKLSQYASPEKKILEMLITKVLKDDTLALTVEIDDFTAIGQMEFFKMLLIQEYFEVDMASSEFKKAQKYIIGKMKKTLFTQDADAVKELRQKEEWLNYVGAVKADLNINFKSQVEPLELENDLMEARIYLDLANDYQINRHADAVSYGLPVVTKHYSDYIVNNENGIIIPESDLEIEEMLDFFIKNLVKWNESLVYDVDIIEQHSSNFISEKWNEVI